MSDFFTSPGFLGTRATLRSDLTLVLILVTALLFNIGFILARRKQFVVHRWVQTSAVILNTLVVLISMVTSYIIHILPGIPAKLNQGDYAVITVHGIVGAITLLLGVFVALRGNELVPKGMRFRNYKLFMRWAYTLYMLATLGGVIVYIIVFVFGI
ncbi:MAG: DUF420 domain-containing protein [Anaerolineales bacterium]|jgi:uncharacterized membrane protein YozB (DUF420 family)